MVKSFNVLFVTLHIASFLYGKIYFGVLHKYTSTVPTLRDPIPYGV